MARRRGYRESNRPSMAVQSPSSLAGETMSPMISIVPFIEPIQSVGRGGGAGMTSAMGLPKRVIRIGFLVACTYLSHAEHLTLNSEMGISFIGGTLDRSSSSGQRLVRVVSRRSLSLRHLLK